MRGWRCRRSGARNMSAANSRQTAGSGAAPAPGGPGQVEGDAARDHAAFPPPPPEALDTGGRGWRKALAAFALSLPVGLAFGWGIGRLGVRVGVSLPAMLLAAGLSFWPHIVLHEAGHALAGLARGMRPLAFGIGPWRWERGQSRWRFRRGGGIGGASGFAALLPRGGRGLSRGDQFAYLCGGPAANLLTAALALSLLPLAAGSRAWTGALLGIALCAALLGLLNLLPFHSQGWRSDGRGLLDLLLRTPDAALQQQLHQVMALCLAGVRPRDWPEALVPRARDASTSPMLAANGDLLRLSWAMDRGDRPAASAAASSARARLWELPAAFRPHLACALAGHAARTLRDRDVLAAWRPLCEGGITDLSPVRAWLDAELLALAGDGAAATAGIAGARGLLERAPDPVSGLLLAEYLDDLERRLSCPGPTSPGAPLVKEA